MWGRWLPASQYRHVAAPDFELYDPERWEREAEDASYFYKFSPGAYAVGIDVLLYAITH